MNTNRGFTLTELLVVVVIVSILAVVAIPPMTGLFSIIRDNIRRYHINSYAKLLKEFGSGGYLPKPKSYGKDDGFGWDFSYVNPNASGVYFMNFLGTDQNVVDPLNNGVGNITCGTECAENGYGYFYHCYQIGGGSGEDAAMADWWGHEGLGDFAVIGARLERDETAYFRRIDNITCY